MATLTQPLNADVPPLELERKVRRQIISIVAAFCLLAVLSGTLAFICWRKLKTIAESQKNLEFSIFITDYNASNDFVVPQVNTIQFLRRGYSITFDSVQYKQEGLSLTGTLGNATELWISSLAVNFVARPYPYKIRDKWDKQTFPWWDNDWNIGSGQTTVGALNPGSSVPFSVTIPNVKQTSDSMQIAVSFTGERYLYSK